MIDKFVGREDEEVPSRVDRNGDISFKRKARTESHLEVFADRHLYSLVVVNALEGGVKSLPVILDRLPDEDNPLVSCKVRHSLSDFIGIVHLELNPFVESNVRKLPLILVGLDLRGNPCLAPAFICRGIT